MDENGPYCSCGPNFRWEPVQTENSGIRIRICIMNNLIRGADWFSNRIFGIFCNFTKRNAE